MTTRQPPELKLVSSFSPAAYPYNVDKSLEGMIDHIGRHGAKTAFKKAIRDTAISDYVLLEGNHNVTLYLKSERDWDMVQTALTPDEAIAQDFLFAPEGYDFRKLKNRRANLQKIVNKTDMRGEVFLDLNREKKSIVVYADTKRAFFKFRDLMEKDDILPVAMTHTAQPQP